MAHPRRLTESGPALEHAPKRNKVLLLVRLQPQPKDQIEELTGSDENESSGCASSSKHVASWTARDVYAPVWFFRAAMWVRRRLTFLQNLCRCPRSRRLIRGRRAVSDDGSSRRS